MQLDTVMLEILIRESKRGNVEARERLIRSSMPLIERWSRSNMIALHKLRLSCRDLSQDVYLLVQKHFARFRGNTAGEWIVWLKQIHTNLFLSLVRGSKGSEGISFDQLCQAEGGGVEDVFESNENTPGSVAMLREQADRVGVIISMMHPDYQHALIQMLNEKTLQEHADMLNTKIHHVRYLRFKAVQEFIALWKKHQRGT